MPVCVLSARAMQYTIEVMFNRWAMLFATIVVTVCAVPLGTADTSSSTGAKFSPAAIDGFRWYSSLEPTGRFLIPVDWQVSVSKGKLLGSIVFSEPKSNSNLSRAHAQMSVNPISNFSRMQSGLVSGQIDSFIDTLQNDSRKRIEMTKPVVADPFSGTAVRFVETLDATPMRFHRYYLANDSSDLLLVVNFQAPVVSWDEAWLSGRLMMTSFSLTP